MKKFTHKHYIICPLVIALFISIIYVTGLPLGLINYNVAGNNIFYLLNIILASALCIIIVKALYPEWIFGFRLKSCVDGLLKYWWTGLASVTSILISSYYAFRPLDKTPAAGTIIIWVVINCFLVAFIEELFVRGVLLKALLTGFKSYKHGIIITVFVSSILFGLGHIYGMLQYEAGLMIMKLGWTIGIGIFLACIYVLTDSLWIVIILHWVSNMSAEILYYYSSSNDMFANALGSLIICLMLAVIGLVYLAKRKHLIEHKNSMKLS